MISLSKATSTVNLTWSADVSSQYPPRYLMYANSIAVFLKVVDFLILTKLHTYHSCSILCQQICVSPSASHRILHE